MVTAVASNVFNVNTTSREQEEGREGKVYEGSRFYSLPPWLTIATTETREPQ